MEIEWDLDEVNGQLNVAINVCLSPHTGLIRLRSSPSPRLQGVKYVLNITATDDNASGGPQSLSAIAQVIVGVDDVNNNKPVFEKVLCITNQSVSIYILSIYMSVYSQCNYLFSSPLSHISSIPKTTATFITLYINLNA